jgi:hypothetical protein
MAKAINREAAAAGLDCSTRTIDRLIAAGELEAFKLGPAKGSGVRVTVCSIERLIDRRESGDGQRQTRERRLALLQVAVEPADRDRGSRFGSFLAIRTVSSSASARLTRPSSRAMPSATASGSGSGRRAPRSDRRTTVARL